MVHGTLHTSSQLVNLWQFQQATALLEVSRIASKLKALHACAPPPVKSNSSDSSDTLQQRNRENRLKRKSRPRKLYNSCAQGGQIRRLVGQHWGCIQKHCHDSKGVDVTFQQSSCACAYRYGASRKRAFVSAWTSPCTPDYWPCPECLCGCARPHWCGTPWHTAPAVHTYALWDLCKSYKGTKLPDDNDNTNDDVYAFWLMMS